ncbi:unnamed protein product [Penicillium egyptiacum]|uniref:Uncharacterized protein n=1 Tax=Penicillium egyptiacum TaxID=1303716 RepID=A0A9W4P2I1_9EURO|nr:unnamed protein product [Penicillium egyptiacum]
MINVTHPFRSNAAQSHIADAVAEDVLDTISSILEHCGPFADPQTRFNGLSVLHKIGKTMALSTDDTLGRKVQGRFESDSSLVDGMKEIINSMTPDAVRVIIEDNSSPNALWPKLQEL